MTAAQNRRQMIAEGETMVIRLRQEADECEQFVEKMRAKGVDESDD